MLGNWRLPRYSTMAMHKLVAAVLSLTLLGCVLVDIAPQVRADRLQHLGVEYRRLDAAELRSAIIGSTVQSLDFIASGDNVWRYGSAGHYWNFGHRGSPRIGRYWMRGDLVCHRLAEEDWCVEIYRAYEGQYLRKLITPSDGRYNDAPERIQITP